MSDFSATTTTPSSSSSSTYFLDLDMCTFYGQDFDDLVSVFQALRQSDNSIKSLMHKLVNPAMIQTIRPLLLLESHARVCLYTKKSGIIREHGVPPEMLKAGEVYIPPTMSLEEYLFLGKDTIPTQMYRPLNRLFKCREVVQEVLGLRHLPELIVTAVRKSVKRACVTLLDPPTNPEFAFLWDDNAEIADDFHVIHVPEYRAVPKAIAGMIEQDLGAVTLDKYNDRDLIFFLLQANPKHISYDFDKNLLLIKKTQQTTTEEEEADNRRCSWPTARPLKLNNNNNNITTTTSSSSISSTAISPMESYEELLFATFVALNWHFFSTKRRSDLEEFSKKIKK